MDDVVELGLLEDLVIGTGFRHVRDSNQFDILGSELRMGREDIVGFDLGSYCPYDIERALLLFRVALEAWQGRKERCSARRLTSTRSLRMCVARKPLAPVSRTLGIAMRDLLRASNGRLKPCVRDGSSHGESLI